MIPAAMGTSRITVGSQRFEPKAASVELGSVYQGIKTPSSIAANEPASSHSTRVQVITLAIKRISQLRQNSGTAMPAASMAARHLRAVLRRLNRAQPIVSFQAVWK